MRTTGGLDRIQRSKIDLLSKYKDLNNEYQYLVSVDHKIRNITRSAYYTLKRQLKIDKIKTF